jgi:hypothetical protein
MGYGCGAGTVQSGELSGTCTKRGDSGMAFASWRCVNSPDFPPSQPPADKAKYRQFLIDHALDPNLNDDDLAREVAAKSDAEREQLRTHWADFVAKN